MTAAATYLDTAIGFLRRAAEREAGALAAAALAASEAVARGGVIYLFGTGHSHLMAEEGHFRAGGLACVVPILATPVMLHEGAIASTRFERMSGLAEIVLGRYPISSEDVLFVFSTSGVNAVPVEAASYGRARGAHVVAMTSIDYSTAAAHGRTRLADVADTVIDTGAPPGDAAVAIDGTLHAGPVSTVLAAGLLNAVFVQVAANLAAAGHEPPVYVSANMPGAAERNRELAERYRARNPHL